MFKIFFLENIFPAYLLLIIEIYIYDIRLTVWLAISSLKISYQILPNYLSKSPHKSLNSTKPSEFHQNLKSPKPSQTPNTISPPYSFVEPIIQIFKLLFNFYQIFVYLDWILGQVQVVLVLKYICLV